jgi:hypothetical protein
MSLDDNNAGLPRLALLFLFAALLFLLLFLLQDTNLAIVSPSNHYQYST